MSELSPAQQIIATVLFELPEAPTQSGLHSHCWLGAHDGAGWLKRRDEGPTV